MFQNWSVKQTIINLGGLLLIVAIIQIYMFITYQSTYIHFGLSFVALFIALIMFHTLNIKTKRNRRRK